MNHKKGWLMKGLYILCFWLGIISIPLALIVFLAKSHEWGIFIGLWPPTLLILSYILEQKTRWAFSLNFWPWVTSNFLFLFLKNSWGRFLLYSVRSSSFLFQLT